MFGLALNLVVLGAVPCLSFRFDLGDAHSVARVMRTGVDGAGKVGSYIADANETNDKQKQEELHKKELREADEADTVGDPCEGLEHCSVVNKLVGGAQAQTVQAELDGKAVVIKIDTKRKMQREAENYDALSSQESTSNLLPTLYHNDELGSDSIRLVLEFLPKPTGEPKCGWTTLGDVSMRDGGFEKVQDVPFELAGELWVSLLQTLRRLKENEWHHCDFHPYNIMVNICTKEFKFIDWERSGQEPGKCPKGSDLLKLVQSFAVLFNKVGTNVLAFVMSGSRNPQSFIEPGSDPKVLATAEKVLSSGSKEDAASQMIVIQELLAIWSGEATTAAQGEVLAPIEHEVGQPSEHQTDRITALVEKCRKGPKVARWYCCKAACNEAADDEDCINQCYSTAV